jgi:DNA polymerase-3 subunit beta
MKLTCDRAKLLAAVQAAAEVSPARATRPIVQCILLDVGEEAVELVATDLDVGIRFKLDGVKADGQGRAAVSAAMLLAVIRDMSGSEVTIDARPEKMVIECGGSRISLAGMDPSDFPEVVGLAADKAMKLPGETVVKMLTRVAYAAGQEESRYAINGVFVKIKKRDMEFVATDTRRLAIARAKLDKDTKMERGAILPLKMVGMVCKLAQGQEEVSLVFRENEAVFACGGAVLSGRLVEGTYPKYEEAVPADCDRKLTVSRDALRAALKQAMNFTTADTRAVIIRPKKDKLEVEAKVAERGEASIVVEAEFAGPEMEVAFNPQFVLDAMSRLEKDQVVIELKDAQRPALIAEGREYLNVIMPVRLRGEGA